MKKSKIEVDFSLKDKVKVKELGITGQVVAIFISKMGIEYKIRYLVDKEPKEYYFYPEDLSSFEQREEIGFKP